MTAPVGVAIAGTVGVTASGGDYLGVRVSTLDTQSDSYRSLGVKKLARQQADILSVVVAQCKAGARDMSLVEIQRAYERSFDRRIEVARISSRVSEMLSGGWLVRRLDTRPCSVTGYAVHPVFPVAKQASFV